MGCRGDIPAFARTAEKIHVKPVRTEDDPAQIGARHLPNSSSQHYITPTHPTTALRM